MQFRGSLNRRARKEITFCIIIPEKNSELVDLISFATHDAVKGTQNFLKWPIEQRFNRKISGLQNHTQVGYSARVTWITYVTLHITWIMCITLCITRIMCITLQPRCGRGVRQRLYWAPDLRVTPIPVTSIDMSGHCATNLKAIINHWKIRSKVRSVSSCSFINQAINLCPEYNPV